jgi:FixJ family two-component response regulator
VIQIIDDDAATRIALGRLLQAAGYKTQTFKSAAEFLGAGFEPSAECLVLDVRMPGMGGIELQKAMATRGNSLPIIFLTCHGTISISVEAMRAGAIDFLTKPVEKADLLMAVETAIRRQKTQRKALAEHQILKDRLASLTPREMEVFVYLVRGWMNKQVAAEIGTGEQNVKVHRASVMTKMRAGTFADLVKLGERLGISGLSPTGMTVSHERAFAHA